MLTVDMGRYDKGMVAFQKAHGQLSPYFIGFLRCDLTGLKGLANLIGYHIMLLLSARDMLILPFGKQKFFVRSFGVTFIGTDKLAVVGLCCILRIVRAIGKTLTNCFALVDVQSDQTCSCHFITFLSKKKSHPQVTSLSLDFHFKSAGTVPGFRLRSQPEQ